MKPRPAPPRSSASTPVTWTWRTSGPRVRTKGGATEWVFCQTGSAQLLPRLLAGRTAGPVFLADRRPGRVGAAVLARLDFVLEQLCADVDAQFVEVVLLRTRSSGSCAAQ